MKIFVIVVVMWWSNPVDRTYNDSIEIDSLDGKPFFFVKQEEYGPQNIDEIQAGKISKMTLWTQYLPNGKFS